MRFIGDIHGNLGPYGAIIDEAEESVQVGDFGVGFLNDESLAQMDEWHTDGRHKFIRGNHDDPDACKARPGYIEDGTYWQDEDVMFIGGAWSIDWAYRTPGYSWWADEELSESELDRMFNLYVENKPSIMVTHDCPTMTAYELFLKGTSKKQYRTRTADAFDRMFDAHQPDIWIFGHWHEDRTQKMRGTQFICLGIDSYIDLDL